MAPLLKPSECSVLVLDGADEPSDKGHPKVIAGRDRILRAASLCALISVILGGQKHMFLPTALTASCKPC